MIILSDSVCLKLAAPLAGAALLELATQAASDRAELCSKLGEYFLDHCDFKSAAAAFESALQLDPSRTATRVHLARTYNELARPGDALAMLVIGADGKPEEAPQPEHDRQRGLSIAGLCRAINAEAEFREARALYTRPVQACMKLCSLLRNGGSTEEPSPLCEEPNADGVEYDHLLQDWGWALELADVTADPERLLFDRRRIVCASLAPPARFSGIEAFNAELLRELLDEPLPLGEFTANEEDESRGAQILGSPIGARSHLVRGLVGSIQNAVTGYVDKLTKEPAYGDDPWLRAMPVRAHLRVWGLIQGHGDFENWHRHRDGWMSGIYHMLVPQGITEEGGGEGCIEFGPPLHTAGSAARKIESWRRAPRAGTLVMAPSHYHHRIIPTGRPDHGIGFAFDLVPERQA